MTIPNYQSVTVLSTGLSENPQIRTRLLTENLFQPVRENAKINNTVVVNVRFHQNKCC